MIEFIRFNKALRKNVLFLGCMVIGVQSVVAQDFFSSASDYARLYVGQVEPQYQLALWQNIPYYKDNTGTYKGRISYYGMVYDNVQLRFDEYRQQVAVLSPVANVYCLPNQQHIDWFEMDGHRYVHDPENGSRFAILLCDGGNKGVRLYHTVWKTYGGEIPVGKTFLKSLKTNEYFTLVTPDGVPHRVKSASDVAKLFPAQKIQIKQFAKQNSLSFEKYEREMNLAKLIENLQSQLPVLASYERMEQKSNVPSQDKDNIAYNGAPSQQKVTASFPRAWEGKGDSSIISGIPVLDTMPVASSSSPSSSSSSSSRAKTYIVPGVKKAIASIADDQELAEIVVIGGRQSAVRSTIMGSEKFKPQLLKNIPSAFGESDIMKIALTLPGVTSVGEASSGINVRGGATDQNLILFNGGTVYNPSHLFGLFTSFNSDMVEEVELFKASVPAQYGGRISSVMTVTSKEANMQKLTGSASIGVLTSKANLEIPILKDHVSLLLNGRTTYSDWILKTLPEKSGYKNGSANFYDFGGVLTVKLNSLHRFKINGYLSKDKFSFTSADNYGYVNRNLSAEWRSIISDKVTGNISVGMDHYDYYNEDRSTNFGAARLSFAIDMLWAKLNVRHRLSEKTNFTYGLNIQHYDVMPGKYDPIGEATVVQKTLDDDKALESAAYIDCEQKLGEKFTVSAGLRYSIFNSLGPRTSNYYLPDELPSVNTLVDSLRETGIVKTYQAPEFRLSGRYAIKDNLSLKASYNTMTQYIHKVSNTTIMSPTDIWKLSDLNIKPQRGWQVSTGIYYETEDKEYELSAEVYYKQMKDYLSYRNSGVLLMNENLERDVISTNGKAYGVELQVKKPFGKLNGWVNYTFSRTLLRQEDGRVKMPVNGGDWFPSEYDRPHELKAVLNYKFTERYSLSGNFNYATGRPTTIPAGKYYYDRLGKYLPYYTERNAYRIPDYVRCDLAFNIEPTHKLTTFLHTSFSIGVYNAFARKNAYNVYYVTEGERIRGYKLSVFGSAIPYVSLNIRFN